MTAFLPYGRHCVEEDDVAAVAEVLRGDTLTTGPVVAAFEHALAAAVSAPGAVVCANGTAALHLAAMSVGLGPGDAAVVPAITFLATANVVRLTGAEVVFADVDPDTGLMGADHLAAALDRAGGARVRAVFPVHHAGQPAPMEEIAALAYERGITIIEDACHALGSTVESRGGAAAPIGQARPRRPSRSSRSTPVKTVRDGRGRRRHGAKPDLAGARAAAAQPRHDVGGGAHSPSMRWPSMPAGAVEPVALRDGHARPELSGERPPLRPRPEPARGGKLARFFRAGGERWRRAYDERIAGLAPLVRPLSRRAGCTPAWHLYVVLIDFAAAGVSRRLVMESLRAEGDRLTGPLHSGEPAAILSATLRSATRCRARWPIRTLPLAAPLSGNGGRRRGPRPRRARAGARTMTGPRRSSQTSWESGPVGNRGERRVIVRPCPRKIRIPRRGDTEPAP